MLAADLLRRQVTVLVANTNPPALFISDGKML